jgi:hypothetical protein
MIDQKTEASLGPFPYDRAVLAKAVRRSAELQARGVVLKFFISDPRSGGDRELAEAMKALPVLLQAGYNQPTTGTNQLPDRFLWGNVSPGHVKAHAASRWGIPLPQLSEAARDVGFVDSFEQERTPILELYSDHYVKSLTLAVLELAFNQKARITPGESLKIGENQVALDAYSQAAIRFPKKDEVSYISLVDFLGSTPLPQVKDRIVIVGLDIVDVKRFPPIQTPIGMVRPHRVFYYSLVSLYESLWIPPRQS